MGWLLAASCGTGHSHRQPPAPGVRAAASVDVVQEQMLLSATASLLGCPASLLMRGRLPGQAWPGSSLLSLGRAAKGRSQLPSQVHTGRPGPSQPRPAPVPPAASRRLPTPDLGCFLTSAGQSLQILSPPPPPKPPLLWGSSEAMEGPTLEEPEVSRPLVVLTPTSAPAAIPCGS